MKGDENDADLSRRDSPNRSCALDAARIAWPTNVELRRSPAETNARRDGQRARPERPPRRLSFLGLDCSGSDRIREDGYRQPAPLPPAFETPALTPADTA